jgi:tRNA A-37 threonylcarbamoyl transferase component Bud32
MATRHLVKYELLEEVGHGGMAVVYRGLDTVLNREVAVKILHSHLAEQQESRQRFQREAHAVAKLRHENIIEIYDYSGIDSPESYIVTEFIHGQTLKDYLARSPISHPEIAAMIIAEVCNALAHAHSLGIIHRDIKPENIMIRDDGRVKLTDFGIAQVIDVQRLTVTGQLLGSPAYMAPELVEGKRIDFRADVFSVGTLLYQLATSEMPFKGKNPHEVLKRIADGRYTDPEVANPVVGGRLARIIRKALAHEPDARYADVGQLRDELLEYLAEVNIADARAELTAYFASTTEYSRGLQQRIVETLTAKGKGALLQRRTPQALECFNRVLCVDPTNREVLDFLDRIARRRRAGRALAVLLLAGALSAASYLLYTRWPRSPLVVAVDARRPTAPDAGPRRRDHRALVVDAAVVASGQDSRLRPVKMIRVNPTALLRQVEIIPTPKAVTIFLNDKELGSYGPDLRSVTLPLSAPAKLSFRNEQCCFERVVQIAARQPLKVLRVKLPWKPGRVIVEVKPKVDADVLVGSLVTQPGRESEVAIPASSEDGRGQVEVKVSAQGYGTETRRITVRANNTVTVPVTLRRTP